MLREDFRLQLLMLGGGDIIMLRSVITSVMLDG